MPNNENTPSKNRRFSFLSRPPPQKKRPTEPVPPVPPVAVNFPVEVSTERTTRRRSSTFTAIANWVMEIEPGTPPPQSPSRSSICSLRRFSISNANSTPIHHTRTTSKSFSHFFEVNRSLLVPLSPARDEPDEDSKKPFNLTNLGYTHCFLHAPYRAPPWQHSVDEYVASTKTLPSKLANMPVKSTEPKPNLMRSLSSLNPIRKRSKSMTIKRQRRKEPLPPSLASEILILQEATGGTLEENIQKFMRAYASAAGPSAGVSDVYRDENGGIWFDRAEKQEYEPLLSQRRESYMQSSDGEDSLVSARDIDVHVRVSDAHDTSATRTQRERRRPAPLNIPIRSSQREFLENPIPHNIKKKNSRVDVRAIFVKN